MEKEIWMERRGNFAGVGELELHGRWQKSHVRKAVNHQSESLSSPSQFVRPGFYEEEGKIWKMTIEALQIFQIFIYFSIRGRLLRGNGNLWNIVWDYDIDYWGVFFDSEVGMRNILGNGNTFYNYASTLIIQLIFFIYQWHLWHFSFPNSSSFTILTPQILKLDRVEK